MITESPASSVDRVPPVSRSPSRSPEEDNVSWFHGKITRDAAGHILKINGGQEGQFLVRESISSPGDYVLSIICNGQPVHYQIRRHGEDAFFSIDEGPVIHGLDELILYYQRNGGLSTIFGPMCKAQPPPPDTRLHGRTNLLHRATKEGSIDIVKGLLKTEYSLDARNQEGQTALHIACIIGHDDIVKLLLDSGAGVNTRDSEGLTPLHYACRMNHTTAARYLLYEGMANPQLRAIDNSWVPLHEAASRGFPEMVKILLDADAPRHPRSESGETARDLAVKNGRTECVTLIDNFEVPLQKATREDWHHENITRYDAHKLFRDNGMTDGLFLVRNSSRKSDISVLSLVFNQHTFNYEIQRKDKFYYIDNGPYLESLEHLICYYMKLADGLPTCLVTPIKPVNLMRFSNSNLANVDNVNQRDEDINHNVNSSSSITGSNLICRESLQFGSAIGEGEFGSVLGGVWLRSDNTKMDVAIKSLWDERFQNGRDNFIIEVEVMVRLNHPNIVRLLGVCLGPPLMMVQELVALGSMLDYILDNEIIIAEDLYLWAAQIACGMLYLEQKRFVHRDLAARNILLASRNQAKISDFGLSRALGVGSEYYTATTGGRWPLKWYAPESIKFGTFSHASDIWSYGVTLWEMFSLGAQPYGNLTGEEIFKLIEANQRLPIPPSCPDHIYEIMLQCWAYEPHSRPTFQHLYNTFSRDPIYSSVQHHLLPYG